MSHSARTPPLRHARRDKPTAASQPYAGGAPKTRRARAARASSGPQLWRRTIARMARLNALACQLLIRVPSEDEIDFSKCRIALFPKGYKNPDISPRSYYSVLYISVPEAFIKIAEDPKSSCQTHSGQEGSCLHCIDPRRIK